MDRGSCQTGRIVGTPSPPPPSPPPSPGSSGWHSGQETIFGVFKLEFDSFESSRNFDTGVLHRSSSRIDLAEWFGLGSLLWKNDYFVNISKNKTFIFRGTFENPKFQHTNQNAQMTISTISTHPKFKFSKKSKNQLKSLTSIPSGGPIYIMWMIRSLPNSPKRSDINPQKYGWRSNVIYMNRWV